MPTLKVLFSCLACCLGSASGAIQIHLYNYAGTSLPTLREATGFASAVLAKAGVSVMWADCPSVECARMVTPEVLQLRIFDRQMASKVDVSKSCLGYALVTGEFSSIASVFYYRAVELEKDNLATRAHILGAMLAHEIGHLLLGRNSHSRQGIMKGVWEDSELRVIAKGRLWFSKAEAEKLGANAEARERASANLESKGRENQPRSLNLQTTPTSSQYQTVPFQMVMP